MSYHRARDDWQAKAPAELGLRADGLRAAMEYRLAHESRVARCRAGTFLGVFLILALYWEFRSKDSSRESR